MKQIYDCVVVGAGPAGCSTATLVSQKGFSTLLVDREKFPRFHVGESLMPETYWAMEKLGIVKKMRDGTFTFKNGVQFVNHMDKESRPFYFPEYDPHESSTTLHVQRAEFDQLLFDNAKENGVDCYDETRVVDVQLSESGENIVELKHGPDPVQKIRARVVVDATGQQAFIANKLGVRETDPDLKKSAIWGYYRDTARQPEGTPEITCILHTNTKKCWFWFIPLSNGTTSVGVVSDNDYLLKGRGTPAQTFQEELAMCPGLQRRLEGASLVSEYHVAREFTYKAKQISGHGWVLVGDAYGFIDPIYSSGVFLAFKSAELAAESIIEALQKNDVSGEQLGKWAKGYDEGVRWIRKLVDAFYTQEFSFGEFMKVFPDHRGNLTDLLVGKVFAGEPGKIFDDMDPWIESIRSGKTTAVMN